MTDSSLLTKYRPRDWDDVIGHHKVVASLADNIEKRRSRAFLLVGPAGTGKTTLARIAARKLGCAPRDLIEENAAKNTGIDNMRDILERLQYRPLGDGASKVVILDEAHRLSASAWDSLLKDTEEASWSFWFFCTTVTTKIPKSIKTRCIEYALKPLAPNILADFLQGVADEEKLKLPSGVLDVCVKAAEGSPRNALSNLALCIKAKNRDEAADLLEQAEEPEQAFKLAQALFYRKGWREVQRVLAALGDGNAEGARRVILAYGTKIMLGAKSPDEAGRTLEILDNFAEPFDSSLGLAPLVIACGKAALG